MKRRTWLPRAAGVAWSTLALFTASSCYRAEIDLSALMDDMVQGGASPSSAGVTGSMSGTQGIAGSPSGAGGDAPGAGGSTADAGAAGATSEAPPCINEPLEGQQQECFDLGRPTPEECSDQDPNGWEGCWFSNCHVCEEALVEFAYYFDWHPCCLVNSTCFTHAPPDAHACSPMCPEPNERDKSPRCDQVSIEP